MTVKISVITPSFNYGRFIDDCISSVQHQSLPAHEHLILDDGSIDDSVDRARRHPAKPQVWEQPNAGLATTLNRLLAKATGDWIGWLNADDFYLEEAFAAVEEAAARSPDASMIVGDTVFVDTRGQTLRLLPSHRVSKQVTLHYGMTAAPSSYFVRAETLREVGFREGTKFLMDKWLFADLLQRGARAKYIRKPLGAMRRHEEQVSAGARGALGNSEREAFRKEFGLPYSGIGLRISKLYGRGLHTSEKVWTGGYWRELAWRSQRGTSLCWWAAEPD